MLNIIKGRNKFLLVSVAICFSLFQNLYANTLGTEINASQTISDSGFYVVGQDISGFIEINADNVCLDLQNYRIYSNASTDAITVKAGRQNVTVKNGSIVGSGVGSSTASGILVEQNSNVVNITDVTVTDCNTGFYLEGISTGTIKGCTVKQCKAKDCNKGYVANYAIKSVFDHCQASNCVQSGFEQANCQYNIFDACKALKTGDGSSASQDVAAFSSSAGTGNLYTECVAEGTNKTASNVSVQAVGLLFNNSETESKVLHSVFNSTSLIGSGTAYGLYIDSDVSRCLIEENRVCNTSGGTGFIGSGDDNVFVKNISYENDAGFSAGIVNVFNKGLNTVGEPNLLDNLCLPSCALLTESCVTTIDASGVYKVADTQNCCIIIDADDVYVDLQCSTLQCTSGHVIQVLAGHKNIEIRNGKIAGSSNYDGIVINDSCEFITIEDMALFSCDNGINIAGADGSNVKSVSVKNCTFHECNKGVLADYGIKSTFERNSAFNCVTAGFEQANAQFNVFDTCKALKTGDGSAGSDTVAGFLSSAGVGNLYTECVTEGTNKASSDVGANLYGLAFLSTETESKVCNCIFNSTSLIGSATAYGLYTGALVGNCLIENNRICNTTGNATGVFGNSNNNVFIKNVAYQNNTNFSANIINVYGGGVLGVGEPNLLDNISLPSSVTVVTCPGDITISDVYDIDGGGGDCCIVIDADDVRLDLQGYALRCSTTHVIQIAAGHKNITIVNGSIEGISNLYDGVHVRSSCEFITIEDINIYNCNNAIHLSGTEAGNIKAVSVKCCNFNACNRGVLADYMIKSVFDHCVAQNCVLSGFEQANSQFNIFDACKALKTGEGSATSDDVVGFVSTSGTGNLYTECVAEGTNKLGSDFGVRAAGFILGSSEQESKILQSIANSTSLTGLGSAHGIYVRLFGAGSSDNLLSPVLDNYANGSLVRSVHWSSDGAYLAIGGNPDGSEDSVKVFSWDGADLTLLDTYNHGIGPNGKDINFVRWSPDGQFLAIGGESGAGNVQVRMFSFDGSSLTLLDSYAHGGRVGSLVWSPDGDYIAIGGDRSSNVNVRVLEFNGSVLSLVADFDHGDSPSVSNDRIRSIDWIKTGTVNYIAIGGVGGAGGYEVRVLNFNGSSLSAIPGANIDYVVDGEEALVRVVAWSPDGSHLAIGGVSDGGGNELQVFSFNGVTLSSVVSYDYGTSVDIRDIDWFSDGTFLLIGGDAITGGYNVRTLSFSGSTLTLNAQFDHGSRVSGVSWAQNNRFIAIGGGTGDGGYNVRVFGCFCPLNCLIEDNRVCNTIGNATGIVGDSSANVFMKNIGYGNDTNFSSGIINVYENGLNSFDEPNLLDNISLPGNTTGKVITCPDVITESGVYEIDGVGNCCILINADDVYLDLKGYTLNCTTTHAIQIAAGHKNITITNGAIEGVQKLYDGIHVRSSCEFIRIEDVSIYNCDNAININGVNASDIKAVSVTACNFNDCNKGVLADYAIKSVFDRCVAQDCVLSGFELKNSQFNVFDKCKALKTGDGSVSSENVVGFSSLAGTGNLYTECVAEGTHKDASDNGISVIGLSFLSTETESKVCNCIFNSTDLVGSGTAYGIYLADTVSSCLVDSNKICNTSGGTGVVGSSVKNVFIRNIGYDNDTNFSAGIINVFTDGLLYNPNLLDNISLPTNFTSCPNTISTAGVYTISDINNCCVVIDADNVTLDLKDYTLNCSIGPAIIINSGYKNITIKNGSIKGDNINDGIFINEGCELIVISDIDVYSCKNGINYSGSIGSMIKSCKIKDCNFYACDKGVIADYLKKSVFDNCVARNCVQAGFEQKNSQFNVYDACVVLDLSNSNSAESAIGFNSTGGTGNLYRECIIEGVSQTAENTSWGTAAIGINFGYELVDTTTVFEIESKIIDCVVDSVISSSFGQSFGIRLEDLIDQEEAPAQVDTLSDSGNATDVAWSPLGEYVAYAKTTGYKIVKFVDQQLTDDIVNESSSTTLSAIDWSADGQWLAAVALNGATEEIEVVKFDGSVGPIAFNNANDIRDIKWYHASHNFVVTDNTTGVVEKYSFDSVNNSITNIATSVAVANAVALDITPDDMFIVVTSGNDFTTLFADSLASAAALEDASDFTTITQVSFNPMFCCGIYYLAIVGNPDIGNNLDIFKFNGQSWVLVDNVSFNSGIDLASAKWSPNGRYLAVSGDPDDIGIYEFDPETGQLNLIHTYDTSFTNELHIDWSPCSRYIIIHGNEGLEVISIGDTTTNCLLDSNKVANCSGGVCGIGIFGSGWPNSIIRNIGYENCVNLSKGVVPKYFGGLAGQPTLIDNKSIPPY